MDTFIKIIAEVSHDRLRDPIAIVTCVQHAPQAGEIIVENGQREEEARVFAGRFFQMRDTGLIRQGVKLCS